MDTEKSFQASDHKFMKLALRASEHGKGYTEPNPIVGAVVIKGDKILAVGFHRQFGGEHAEVMALKAVNEKNTTLYVTLEPCCHFGKTAPCTDLIVRKRVSRVVVALIDPNPQVNGKGIKALRNNDITVNEGLMRQSAEQINRHYLHFMRKKIPYIALKAGVSLDGKLTDWQGKSQWVTDSQLRQLAHSLRGEFSGIMAGVNTVIEDNARLTIREAEWKGKQLHRIILDSENILDVTLNVFKDQDRFPLVIFSSLEAKNKRSKVKNHFFIPGNGKHLQLAPLLETLFELGICSVLVEGGGEVLDSFLSSGYYNELIFFTADKLIGGQQSVQLFSTGASIDKPIILRDKQIVELKNGHIVRGFK